MSTVPAPDLPGALEALVRADAEFARLLLDAAPMPEGSTKDPGYFELVTRYDRYMPSREVTAIMRFLYMLEAYSVSGGEALRRLIEAHNERMAALAGDAAYLTRMRVPKSRLLQARFTKGAVNHTVVNFAYNGRVALDATAMGRLLVEFANKTQVGEAMELLASLGLFRTAEGNYNATVYLSTGRLEAVYRGYLAHVAQGLGEALAGPRGAVEGGSDA